MAGVSHKTKYFVSNYYVEKIVDNMQLDQDRNMEKIEGILAQLHEKLEVINTIKNNDLPEMTTWIEYSQKRITKVIETQFRNYAEMKEMRTKRSCWDILVEHLRYKQKDKRKFRNLVSCFRKY